jgi:hypothetical protein
MTCPKCQSPNTEPTLSWTICGRKMTPPQIRVWACLNLKCRHEWPREITSPMVASISENDIASVTQPFPRLEIDAEYSTTPTLKNYVSGTATT